MIAQTAKIMVVFLFAGTLVSACGKWSPFGKRKKDKSPESPLEKIQRSKTKLEQERKNVDQITKDFIEKHLTFMLHYNGSSITNSAREYTEGVFNLKRRKEKQNVIELTESDHAVPNQQSITHKDLKTYTTAYHKYEKRLLAGMKKFQEARKTCDEAMKECGEAMKVSRRYGLDLSRFRKTPWDKFVDTYIGSGGWEDELAQAYLTDEEATQTHKLAEKTFDEASKVNSHVLRELSAESEKLIGEKHSKVDDNERLLEPNQIEQYPDYQQKYSSPIKYFY